jgi:hypothetical protein
MNKTQKDLSDIELKAIAYDEMTKIEKAHNILNIINQELASRAQNTQTKTKMGEETVVTPEVTEKVVETVEETVAEVAE